MYVDIKDHSERHGNVRDKLVLINEVNEVVESLHPHTRTYRCKYCLYANNVSSPELKEEPVKHMGKQRGKRKRLLLDLL